MDAFKTITDSLEYLQRTMTDQGVRYDTATKQGRKLAQAVYDHLENGTHHTHEALRAAYDEFVTLEAANFWPVAQHSHA